MDQRRSKLAYKLGRRHYWQQIRQDWKLNLPSFLLVGVGTIFVFYIPPLIIARIVESYTRAGDIQLSALVPYILAFAGFWLLGEMMWRLGMWLLIKAEAQAIRRLYVNAVSQLLYKDLSFFHDNFAGSLTKKTVSYAQQYEVLADTLVFNVAPYLIPALFISVVLWRFSPVLVLILFGLIAFVIALVVPLIIRRKKLVAIRETAKNKTAGFISDIYSNVDAVKSFAGEKFEHKQHVVNVRDLTGKMRRSWDYHNNKINMTISPLYVVINTVGLVMALVVAERTQQSIEVVFVTFSYFTSITRFFWEFNDTYRRIETAFSEAAQFAELLIDEPVVQDAIESKPFHVSDGAIEFRDMLFDHEDIHDHKRVLFKDFNLKIQPGEKVGLVGHSGGGKTTLTKLLLRFMDVDGGSILIDDQDISLVKQADLRTYLSYVPQEPIMFHRTLAENIAYGKPDSTMDEVEKAAKMAHAHEFITQLPAGYETLVGERGVKLSGGQRQRIAIARAMLKDAPILLLDEATSALDSGSEKLIQEALWRLMEGKTAIVIAHRLSTIQKMDRIVVLENGKIIEEGSHWQLLKNNGVYAQLWQHQSGGYIEE